MKLNDLQPGDIVMLDDGYSCTSAGRRTVEVDLVGDLFVPCAEGQHFLYGQRRDDGSLTGVFWPGEIEAQAAFRQRLIALGFPAPWRAAHDDPGSVVAANGAEAFTAFGGGRPDALAARMAETMADAVNVLSGCETRHVPAPLPGDPIEMHGLFPGMEHLGMVWCRGHVDAAAFHDAAVVFVAREFRDVPFDAELQPKHLDAARRVLESLGGGDIERRYGRWALLPADDDVPGAETTYRPLSLAEHALDWEPELVSVAFDGRADDGISLPVTRLEIDEDLFVELSGCFERARMISGHEAKVRQMLADLYEQPDVETWLTSAQELLDGRVPMDVIRAGDGHRVIIRLSQINEGVHL